MKKVDDAKVCRTVLALVGDDEPDLNGFNRHELAACIGALTGCVLGILANIGIDPKVYALILADSIKARDN